MSTGVPWQRLDPRMIWVDALQSALSLTPAIAVAVLGQGPRLPVLIVAVIGVGGAVADVLRWVKTRYRVTDEHVERRTGLLVRRYRSVRRDRIRSVDTTAKLRHRLAGLRLVTIGAGQQQAAGEAALSLDAVSRATAEELRRTLLQPAGQPEGQRSQGPEQGRELARIRWSWTVYNMFNVWAYLGGAGVLWGLHWLGSGLGFSPVGYVFGLVGWGGLGWVWSALIVVVGVGACGVGVLAVSFVTENWNFRLVRVPGRDGTVLRTTQGLFKTREVNRDDNRLRGVEISEPLLWRWMGVADTNVISTGLTIWSLTPATTILPRGPVDVARPVAAAVLGQDPNPLAAPLRRHPRTALRRRRLWALWVTAAGVGLLVWLAAAGPLPVGAPVAGTALLPVTLGAAAISYRALGHALVGDYLVVRSGLVSRSTAALQTRAVVGWRLRQSVLQRRLGLASFTAATAAGHGAYGVSDLDADGAVVLAGQAVPDLLTPVLEHSGEPT